MLLWRYHECLLIVETSCFPNLHLIFNSFLVILIPKLGKCKMYRKAMCKLFCMHLGAEWAVKYQIDVMESESETHTKMFTSGAPHVKTEHSVTTRGLALHVLWLKAMVSYDHSVTHCDSQVQRGTYTALSPAPWWEGVWRELPCYANCVVIIFISVDKLI